MKTRGLIGKNLFQSRNDYGKRGSLFGLFLALKIKNCFAIDKKDILSLRTTFKGNDQNITGLIFTNFLDLENGATSSITSKLNWKRDLYAVKVPHRAFQCFECDKNQMHNQCESEHKKKRVLNECEIVGSLKEITQIKYYSTKINKLKRLPENEFGYMLPNYKKGSD